MLKGHSNSVLSLNFFFNENFLLSGSFDGTIKLWMLTKCNCNFATEVECPCSECVIKRVNSKKNRARSRKRGARAAVHDLREKNKPRRSKYLTVRDSQKEGLVRCSQCRGKGFLSDERALQAKKDWINLSGDLREANSKRKKKQAEAENSMTDISLKCCDMSRNSMEMLNLLVQDLNQTQHVPKPDMLRNLGNVLKTRWDICQVQSFDRSQMHKNNQVQFVIVDKNNESQLFSFKKGPSRSRRQQRAKAARTGEKKEAKAETGLTDENMRKILEIKKVVEPLYENGEKQVPENLTDFLDFLKNVFKDISAKVNKRLSQGEDEDTPSQLTKSREEFRLSQVDPVSGSKVPSKHEELPKNFRPTVIAKRTDPNFEAQVKRMNEFLEKLELIPMDVKTIEEMSPDMLLKKFKSFKTYVNFLEAEIVHHKTEKMILQSRNGKMGKELSMFRVKARNQGAENHMLLVKLENKAFKLKRIKSFLHECGEQIPDFRELYFKHKASLSLSVATPGSSQVLLPESRFASRDLLGLPSSSGFLKKKGRNTKKNAEAVSTSQEKELISKRGDSSFSGFLKTDQSNPNLTKSSLMIEEQVAKRGFEAGLGVGRGQIEGRKEDSPIQKRSQTGSDPQNGSTKKGKQEEAVGRQAVESAVN